MLSLLKVFAILWANLQYLDYNTTIVNLANCYRITEIVASAPLDVTTELQVAVESVLKVDPNNIDAQLCFAKLRGLISEDWGFVIDYLANCIKQNPTVRSAFTLLTFIFR